MKAVGVTLILADFKVGCRWSQNAHRDGRRHRKKRTGTQRIEDIRSAPIGGEET